MLIDILQIGVQIGYTVYVIGAATMAKVKFTAGRVADFKCTTGKLPSFLWDTDAPGLGLRASPGGTNVYIFQAKLNGETIRLRLGAPSDLTIDDARKQATEHRRTINNGQDPRILSADRLAAEQEAREAKQAEEAAIQTQQQRDAVTLGDVWPVYIEDRLSGWSELHHRDHLRIIQAGGIQRKRSKKMTEAGPLASLAKERLVDLTPQRIELWAKAEAKVRPTRARLALRLLKACLTWCAGHENYAGIIVSNGAKSKKARESLGKSKVKKYDLIQREQLAGWFSAVRQISTPVVAAYLQVLLLTGARREELATLRWKDVDFRWKNIKLGDKVEDFRMIPLTPYVAHLLNDLKRRNETSPNVRVIRRLSEKGETWQPSPWVFSSSAAKSGRLTEPSIAHRRACAIAGMDLSLHGLRRSFATLALWTDAPGGVAAQIQGHAPQGVRETNYIFRSIDLLREGHEMIEAYMLKEAKINFILDQSTLKLVTTA